MTSGDVQEREQSIVQLLQRTAQDHPQNGFIFYAPSQAQTTSKHISYSDFLSRIKDKALLLQGLGLNPGLIVLIHFKEHQENLEWFWAVTYAGYVPAISTPLSNNLEQRKCHLLHLHSMLNNPLCLMKEGLVSDFASQSLLWICTIEELSLTPVSSPTSSLENERHSPIDPGSVRNETEIAALMLTSGSTGNAKAVCLTHSQIVASVAGKRDISKTNTNTTFFNWIGADHVACLTEIHLHALSVGSDQVFVPAADVVTNPFLFLEIINRHRVGYTFAPHFFLASLQRALREPGGEAFTASLDLTCLDTIVSGGEANVVSVCAALAEILKARGAPANCLKPAFGMTETSAGSIYNASFPEHDLERNHEFASVGKRIQGMDIRIVDNDGVEAGLEGLGNLEVRGPAVFSRYYGNPEATASSFHDDWFITGDQGKIDSAGRLSLMGRTKDTLIINGVNYAPYEIETVIDNIRGTTSSYNLAFAYRPKKSDTESVCIVYLPAYDVDDLEARIMTNNAISSTVMQHIGVRPLIIPLDAQILQKSSLGKLPRGKIAKAFQDGDFDSYLRANEEQTKKYQSLHYEEPKNKTETLILQAFTDILNVTDTALGVNANLYAFGVTSIDIIKLRKMLERQLEVEIPTIAIIANPTARGIAAAFEGLQEPHVYNPVVPLQRQGSKTPLWLIHPGVGEILVFFGLASHLTDRPVYAMRARGFEKGEEYFASLEEAILLYKQQIKVKQPYGPYAIAGYSFGSIIAFEIVKRLEADGDEIAFLGVFNLPPYIRERMRQLDWTNCLLHLSYFLDFFSEEHADSMHPILRQQKREQALEHVLNAAPKARMEELGLDALKLANWVGLAYSLQSSALDYEPSGTVECMDVFCAIPLATVAKDVDDWVINKLGKWQRFVTTQPRFHRVDGAHYTMLSPEHVHSFQNILKCALEKRGL